MIPSSSCSGSSTAALLKPNLTVRRSRAAHTAETIWSEKTLKKYVDVTADIDVHVRDKAGHFVLAAALKSLHSAGSLVLTV